jgi:hypothetical protein
LPRASKERAFGEKLPRTERFFFAAESGKVSCTGWKPVGGGTVVTAKIVVLVIDVVAVVVMVVVGRLRIDREFTVDVKVKVSWFAPASAYGLRA